MEISPVYGRDGASDSSGIGFVFEKKSSFSYLIGELASIGISVWCASRQEVNAKLALFPRTHSLVLCFEQGQTVELPSGLTEQVMLEKIIVFHWDSSLQARLSAVRAGLNHFYSPEQFDAFIQFVQSRCNLTKDGNLAAVQMKVLVVDDDRISARLHSKMLEKNGFVVEVCVNPLNALNIIKAFMPDLIFLDLYMPEISGVELAGIVRQFPEFQFLPIVFLTAEQDMLKFFEEKSLYGDGVLLKPVESDILVRTAKSRAQRFRMMRETQQALRSSLREVEFQKYALDRHAIVNISDPDGSMTYVNDQLCHMSQYSRAELLGRQHNIFNSGYHPVSFFKELWATILKGQVWSGVICNRRKDGSHFWVETTIVPFSSESGEIIRYVAISTDLTHQKEVEAALASSEARFKRSQMLANIGNWDLDLQTEEMYWSGRIAPLFGFTENVENPSFADLLSKVHSQDRASFRRELDGCANGNAGFEIEHRVMWPEGEIRWVLERGGALRNANGEATHLLGVVQDITDRKILEQQMADQGKLLACLNQGIGHFLVEGRFTQIVKDILQGVCDVLKCCFGFFGQPISGQVDLNPAKPIIYCNKKHHFFSSFQEIYPFIPISALELQQAIVNAVEHHRPNRKCSTEENYLVDAKDCSLFVLPIVWGDVVVAYIGFLGVTNPFVVDLEQFLKPLATTLGVLFLANKSMQSEQQARKKLVMAKDEAEKASQAKSLFLSQMSHELRTPLNAILGFSQLLQLDFENTLSETQKNNVADIYGAGVHLLELINDILELSRIEAGKVDVEITNVVLQDMITACTSLLDPLAAKMGVSIQIDPEFLRDAQVLADHRRLKQILLNLMSNGIKYNRMGGSLIIGVRPDQDPGFLELFVRDTGMGISTEKQKYLFQAFERLGKEKTEIEGAGIGLVITRKLADLMGCHLRFESEVGKGTAFFVKLALFSNESPSKNDFGNVFSSPPLSQGQELLLLLIDGERENIVTLQQLTEIFTQLNLMVASDFEEGAALARIHRPDLILLDFNVRLNETPQSLVQINKDPRLKHVPVIIIATPISREDKQACMDAGCAGFLAKPFDAGQFLEALSHFV